jgi:hypothetical protein
MKTQILKIIFESCLLGVRYFKNYFVHINYGEAITLFLSARSRRASAGAAGRDSEVLKLECSI